MSLAIERPDSAIHETMRIGGKTVDTDERVEVFHPYDNSLVGTTPKGTAAHAREAFEVAAN